VWIGVAFDSRSASKVTVGRRKGSNYDADYTRWRNLLEVRFHRASALATSDADGSLGIAEFREVHYKPYRVIDRIFSARVVVYCVLDGTRDMQSLLQRRLTR